MPASDRSFRVSAAACVAWCSNRNDDVTAGMVKSVLAQNLSRWLGQRIVVDMLEVSAVESTLNVDLRYRVIATGETRQVRFQRQGGAL